MAAVTTKSPKPRFTKDRAHIGTSKLAKTARERQPSLHEALPVGSKERSRLKNNLTPRTKHGGQEWRGVRKTTRPFTPKAPIHLVLKSSRAKGQWSMLHRKNKAKILSMIYVYADRFKVHVYRASNVGNHIHLLVKAEEKKNLQDYLRVLAGRIAVTVTGARKFVKQLDDNPTLKHAPKSAKRKFWDFLFWSRLVNWGSDFYNTSRYVLANELEEFSKEHREWLLNSWQITGASVPAHAATAQTRGNRGPP